MKNWYKSKTLWFNLLGIIVGLFGKKIGLDISPEITAQGIALGNVGLRLGTGKKLTMKNVNIAFMFFICLVGLTIFTLPACSFKADSMSYDDGETVTTVDGVESNINNLKQPPPGNKN